MDVARRCPPKQLTPKTPGQARYVEAIRRHTVTLCIGPAGTGKSFVACGVAVEMLRAGAVKKLIMTRPQVECGKKNGGALPGNAREKIAPFMRPVVDALTYFLGEDALETMERGGLVEVVPLEYMRGATFDNAFLLADESQNTDPVQAKMFLTRFGSGCRVVMCGDLTQDDLGQWARSGLGHAYSALSDPDIAKVELGEEDVVRNGLIRTIISQWDRDK